MAKCAKAAGVPRYLFASSCSIYGKSGGKPITEDGEMVPLSAYAQSKIEAEKAIRALADELVLVRPFLTCQREDILNYLSALGQAFCEDSSNLNEAYKRNFIRHSLLPMLRASYGPNVDEHLLGFSTIAEECNQALQHYALRWLNDSGIGGDDNMFRQSAFTAEPWPVIQLGLEMFWKRNQWPLQAMTRQHWDQIREIVSADDDSTTWRSRLNLPNNLLLFTKRSWIKIESPFALKL